MSYQQRRKPFYARARVADGHAPGTFIRSASMALALAVWTLAGACAPIPAAPVTSVPPTTSAAPPAGAPTAAPAQTGGAPIQGGSLTVGLNSQPSTLDPNRWSSALETSIARQIYDYLVDYESKEPRISAALAESWTMSPNGQTYTFKLRRGVKFHDGSSFDAAAARKNLQRLSTGAPSSIVRDVAANLAATSAPDDATLVVDLKSPSPAFLNTLASVPMTSPLAWEQWGDDYGAHPVGTGPFKIREWVAQDHLSLERNPDYAWAPVTSRNRGRAYLDSVTFKFIVDAAARLVSLEMD